MYTKSEARLLGKILLRAAPLAHGVVQAVLRQTVYHPAVGLVDNTFGSHLPSSTRRSNSHRKITREILYHKAISDSLEFYRALLG